MGKITEEVTVAKVTVAVVTVAVRWWRCGGGDDRCGGDRRRGNDEHRIKIRNKLYKTEEMNTIISVISAFNMKITCILFLGLWCLLETLCSETIHFSSVTHTPAQKICASIDRRNKNLLNRFRAKRI